MLELHKRNENCIDTLPGRVVELVGVDTNLECMYHIGRDLHLPSRVNRIQPLCAGGQEKTPAHGQLCP